jgi:hypothetical protein
MRRLHWEDFSALAPEMSTEERRAVSVAGAAHALHDGYTDLIYILLPIWQAEFGLSYAALAPPPCLRLARLWPGWVIVLPG